MVRRNCFRDRSEAGRRRESLAQPKLGKPGDRTKQSSRRGVALRRTRPHLGACPTFHRSFQHPLSPTRSHLSTRSMLGERAAAGRSIDPTSLDIRDRRLEHPPSRGASGRSEMVPSVLIPGGLHALLASDAYGRIGDGVGRRSRLPRSRFLWNNNQLGVFVTPMMDWPESTEPVLTVFPRGLECHGGKIGLEVVVKENPAEWTSSFESLEKDPFHEKVPFSFEGFGPFPGGPGVQGTGRTSSRAVWSWPSQDHTAWMPPGRAVGGLLFPQPPRECYMGSFPLSLLRSPRLPGARNSRRCSPLPLPGFR
jgi:hypothetical protein